MASLDGVATRGLVNGRGPRRSRGRDEVGTCSDEPDQTHPAANSQSMYINEKEANLKVYYSTFWPASLLYIWNITILSSRGHAGYNTHKLQQVCHYIHRM